LSPEIRFVVDADVFEREEGSIERLVMARGDRATGVRERGTVAVGLPRNLRRSCRPRRSERYRRVRDN